MIRAKKEIDKQGFRWRANDTSRLEGISDAMFAFAITLLVVSLEVPNNFADLLNVMKGFVGFALCFCLISFVWYQHYIYFRRYGLDNTMIISINFFLVFIVMFFIYPLKFLANILVYQFFDISPLNMDIDLFFKGIDYHGLMLIYSIGYSLVFLSLFSLYLYAYKVRESLELNALEILLTKDKMTENLMMAVFGILSILIAIILPKNLLGLSGMIYFFIGPAQYLRGRKYGNKISILRNQVTAKK
jgi:uncharacterized membrane protein